MYNSGYPQIPPPASSEQYVPMNSGRQTHQVTASSQTLPPQIPPPGIEMMPPPTQPIMHNLVRVPFTPHQPPPNFAHRLPLQRDQQPVRDPSMMVPRHQPPQQSAGHMTGHPTVANVMSSTPAKTMFTPDYSGNDTSFTGIGTSFDTPDQRGSVKQASAYASTNTSFTGIGLSFETPESSPAKVKSKYYCDVCHFDLGEEESYNKHCQGLMHKQKVSEREGKRPPPSTAGPSKTTEEPKPKVIQDLREKYPDQYCEVCDTTMTSSIVFKQHLQGIRHKKNVINRATGAPVLRGRGNRRLPKTQAEAEENLRCQKLLDECEDPLIGLQYMVEYTKNNPTVEERYVCELCDGKCDPRTLLPHIVGTKHRCNYIKKYHESLIEPHIEPMKTMRKAERTMLMADLANKVYEIEDGPKRMKAKVEIDPFYNPNQEVRKGGKGSTGGSTSDDGASAQKRGQSVDNGPPAKRPPKSKATPNWGGPDPSKQLKRAEGFGADRFSNDMNPSSSGGQYQSNQANEEDGYQRANHQPFFPQKNPQFSSTSHNYGPGNMNQHQQDRDDNKRFNMNVNAGPGKEVRPMNMSPGNSANGTGTGPTKSMPQNLSDIMQNLSKCLVNNEEEASMALQVSNTLTQALLQYRLKNLASSSPKNKSSSSSPPQSSS